MFSVITVVKNNNKGLLQTINSLRKQTYKKIDHIIIDGGSRNFIKKLKSKVLANSKIISENDSGTSDAFNKGLALAKSKYIFWLSAGDTIQKNFFYENSLLLVAKPDLIINSQKIIQKKQLIRINKISIEQLYSNNFHCNYNFPGWVIKRSSFLEVGQLNTSLKYANDVDFMFRFLRKKRKVIINENSFVRFKLGGSSSKMAIQTTWQAFNLWCYYKKPKIYQKIIPLVKIVLFIIKNIFKKLQADCLVIIYKIL